MMSSDSEAEMLKKAREYISEPEKALSLTSAVPPNSNTKPPGSPHIRGNRSTNHDDSCIELYILKMEKLIQEMQHPELGVSVRSQKLFLTSIPCAFVGYDVVEWIMDNLDIEDQSGPVVQEALQFANLLCQHGYFFPVGENAKTYTIKDDSTLYRFQAPEYWPSRNNPDNTKYALYLLKRTLKNKPKGSLEDYEVEALQRLKKLLSNKWDTTCQIAAEQIAQSKDRKKPDKVISSSQERAYWRIHRPPPGTVSCLERCPVPSRRGPKKKTCEQLKRQIKILQNSISRSRTKSTLWQRCEDYKEFDAFLCTPLPSNPWITDDQQFWLMESHTTDTLTERRLRRWTLSLEELLSDPRGFKEFETYLRLEYSHENILFWKAVQNLKRGSHSTAVQKVAAIHSEYLASGAPCEVNLDSATMEITLEVMKTPSRYTFENAQQHVYTLMQTDIYPRFLRSDYFRNLMVKASLLQIQSQRKRFFNFTNRKKPWACGAETGPQVPRGHLANTGLLYGQTSRMSAAITEQQAQQAPPTRLSGLLAARTCDLRESIISDDGSMSVANQFSGRHSLSTSALQSLTAPNSAANEIFDTDEVIKQKGKALSAEHSPILKRATTNSTSDADLDSSVVATSPAEPAGQTPDEAFSPSSAASPGTKDNEDAHPAT